MYDKVRYIKVISNFQPHIRQFFGQIKVLILEVYDRGEPLQQDSTLTSILFLIWNGFLWGLVKCSVPNNIIAQHPTFLTVLIGISWLGKISWNVLGSITVKSYKTKPNVKSCCFCSWGIRKDKVKSASTKVVAPCLISSQFLSVKWLGIFSSSPWIGS